MSLRAPELVLEDDEAKPLAQAISDVAQFYELPDMTEKAVAWIALAVTVGRVYAPKALLIRQRLAADEAKPVGSNIAR